MSPPLWVLLCSEKNRSVFIVAPDCFCIDTCINLKSELCKILHRIHSLDLIYTVGSVPKITMCILLILKGFRGFETPPPLLKLNISHKLYIHILYCLYLRINNNYTAENNWFNLKLNVCLVVIGIKYLQRCIIISSTWISLFFSRPLAYFTDHLVELLALYVAPRPSSRDP